MPDVSTTKQDALPHAELVARFHYDPLTGQFYCRRNWGRNRAGQIVGQIDAKGYRRILIKARQYLAHRLAFFYAHGRWPVDNIDHINGDPADNRIANLRECSQSDNVFWSRRKIPRSGAVGVKFHAGKWEASIKYRGKTTYLGRFASRDEASAAYQAKARELRGAAVDRPAVLPPLPPPMPLHPAQVRLSKPPLTAAGLRSLLHYDPETGAFTWLKTRNVLNATKGAVAGRLNREGYRIIKVHSRAYLAHRLAWLYVAGEWPKGHIDHKNNAPDDNRFSNLRDVAPGSNMANRRLFRNNSIGLKGVCRNGGGWSATVYKDKQRHHLGTFATAEDAHAAYVAAARDLHGEFARGD